MNLLEEMQKITAVDCARQGLPVTENLKKILENLPEKELGRIEANLETSEWLIKRMISEMEGEKK